jgi:riboflavin biosynthesis protein RibD
VTDDYMGRAIALAQRAQGLTSPNPPVGAVLVKGGRIVGEGFTLAAGHEHAEIVALQRAGSQAHGATLFVTLEPCSHWGRTPPCADALVSAGIAAAHVATPDPNPRVNGEGIRRLEQHGIPVTLGERAPEAIELAEAHARYVRCGLPFVTLLLDPPQQVAESMESQTDAILTDLIPPPHPPARSSEGVRPPLVVLASNAGRIPEGADRMMLVLSDGENRHRQEPPEDRRVL